MDERDEAARRDGRAPARNLVDDTIEGTFPASDPPGWGPLHIGAPGDHPEPHDDAPPMRDSPEPPPAR